MLIGGFVLSRSSVIVVVASLVFHCCAFGLLAWTTPSERSSLTTTPSSLLNAVIWAPVKEEMFFRGIVFVVLCNRSARPAKSVKRISSSAIGSGLLFSLVHLANIRRAASKDQHALDTSSSYVALQCASAAIIGMFLSIRFARSGSLLECVILHAINNAFAQLLLGGNLVSLDTVYTRLLLTGLISCDVLMDASDGHVGIIHLRKLVHPQTARKPQM
ncbi:TPA: hypothetical protein N0F65_009206 [Lagenidium giganteum]|uniref:CAAX prenyl protease 2/Lysostaphin resistance protein A-like domain-containing protein n=1 Tax=Lagenidium giganteum TaxID=4803 RepID=A0AAV2YLD6_9STRA|nr:TPA: hypothetical protein N0F65_009206 [Lagenidium giganteum]